MSEALFVRYSNCGNFVLSVVRNSEGPHPGSFLYTILNRKSICSFEFVCCSIVVCFLEGPLSEVCKEICPHQAFTVTIQWLYEFMNGWNSQKHIWSFAGAADETTKSYSLKCLCIHSALTRSCIPSFVGNDYFWNTAYIWCCINYYPYCGEFWGCRPYGSHSDRPQKMPNRQNYHQSPYVQWLILYPHQ